MRIVTFLIALIYGLSILLISPLIFVRLNSLFTLPVYSLSVFKIVGKILIFFGIMTWLHCVILFFSFGKGTPVPTNPPKMLVTKGIYKYSRNPMYLSVLIILFGYFFLLGHLLLLLYLILTTLFFHLFITLYEEPTLRKKFGEDYIEFCNKIPRWL